MTKDEKFLITLYRHVQGKEEGIYNPRLLAKELGWTDHLLNNVLKGLMQANLVKRYSPEEIGLTSRGLEVAEGLVP